MGDNEYGGGPEVKEPQEQPETGEKRSVWCHVWIMLSSQERRRSGPMKEAGGKMVLEHSAVGAVGEVREDEG